MSDDNDLGAWGCLVVIGLLIWGGWWLATSCVLCDQGRLTQHCAKAILEDTCGSTQEIQDVVEVTEKDAPPKMRRVVYEFKYRPDPGKVTTSNIMRTSSVFVYGEGKWITFCQ
jgi:hypothetical protein